MKSIYKMTCILAILLPGCANLSTITSKVDQPTITVPVPTNTEIFEPTQITISFTGCVNISSLRVRSLPSTNSNILDGLVQGDCVLVSGRNRDASWVRISSNRGTGWVSSSYLDISGDIEQLQIFDVSPQKFSSSQEDRRKEYLYNFIFDVVDNAEYDRNTSVLHKYLHLLSIDFTNQALIFTIFDSVENVDDFILLAHDLILWSAIASKPGELDGWNLQRIELGRHGENDSYDSAYVEGADIILGISEGQIDVIGVMVVDVNTILAE